MSIEQIIFIVLSALALAAALGVILSKNPVNSVLCMIICFVAIAGHYIMLNAQFIFIVHLIVYTGAIMVLFLFVLMMMNLNAEIEPQKRNWLKYAGALSGGALLLVMVGALREASLPAINAGASTDIGLIANLGKTLFTSYVVPFELSSVLFLSAMVGAVIIGRK